MHKGETGHLRFFKNPIFWRNILIVALLVSLIPLFVIAQYNHSCVDDFSYGIHVRQAWLKTHSLIDVAKAVAATVSEFYQTWQGTYSAIVLFSIQPAVWGEQYYAISTYVLLAFFLWGVFAFFRGWIGRTYGRKDIADIVACCVSIAFIQLVPVPVESFFWWNGASFYIIWNALMLVQISQFLNIAHTRTCKPLQCVIVALLGGLLAGSNYITALLTAEVTVLFLIDCIYTRKCWKQAGIVLLVTLVGFIISVTAPGNAFRQQRFAIVPPLYAIIKSFLLAYQSVVFWTSDMLLALLAFFLPFAIGIQRNAKAQKVQAPLWLKLSLLVCLFVSTFTPTIYAGNGIGPERAQNMRFLLWVMVCFILEFLIVQHTANWIKKRNFSPMLDELNAWFTPKKAVLLFGVLLILVFLAGMRSYSVYKFDSFTSVSAAHSLWNGEAKAYDRIAEQRMEMLLSDEKSIVLPPFTQKPFVLFFDDITDDPNDWSNKAMAEYFEKDTVVTIEIESD